LSIKKIVITRIDLIQKESTNTRTQMNTRDE